jgi:hypothetical protein
MKSPVDIIYAADVGRPSNLGWARCADGKLSVGDGARSLAEAMASDASNRLSLAIGFECPLFLPVADEPTNMLKARTNEGRRSWSAGAAPSATTSGIVAMAWVLRRFAEMLGRVPAVFTEWDSFAKADGDYRLLVWEAFVSEREQKSDDVIGEPAGANMRWVVKDQYHLLFDQADAIVAANAMAIRIGEASDVEVPARAESISLVHAVVAWLGWPTVQASPTVGPLVRKASKPNWDVVPQLLESAGVRFPVPLKDCFRKQRSFTIPPPVPASDHGAR